MAVLPAFGFALVASAILSLGMVLQKRHIAFIGHKGRRDARWRRDLAGWVGGFTLVNLAPPFNYLALIGLPPTVVAAVAGSNVAFAALFSALLLGERLGAKTAILTILLFLGIGLAGLRGQAGAGDGSVLLHLVWLFVIIPSIAATLLLVGRGRAKRKDEASAGRRAVAIGGVAGALGGFMFIPLQILGSRPPSLESWLLAPWLWLYLGAGIVSFAIVQIAYKDGAMNRVAPAYYGLQVLWPALASHFAYSLDFDPVQWLAFALVAAAVVLIAKGEGRVQDRSSR